MSIKKVKVVITGSKDGKESVAHECKWDGDLGDWMDIGGECAAAIEECDKVTMYFKSKTDSLNASVSPLPSKQMKG